MRHRKSGVKLGRTGSHRKAMFRNMVTSLFKYDRIRTTDAKAKELRSWADHMVTLAKRGDLHARRQALSIIREKNVVHRLFEEAGERFGGISGGYTRIIKVGRRPGDAAPISIIELVAPGKKDKKKKTKAEPAEEKKQTVEQKAEPDVEKTPAAEEKAQTATEPVEKEGETTDQEPAEGKGEETAKE